MTQFRLSTTFVALTTLCLFLSANVRHGDVQRLGHVSYDYGGHDIIGCHYGWPWRYRTEQLGDNPERLQIMSSRLEEIAFNVIYWDSVCWNVGVAIGASLLVGFDL